MENREVYKIHGRKMFVLYPYSQYVILGCTRKQPFRKWSKKITLPLLPAVILVLLESTNPIYS
jgi:hypothetical protein